MKTLKFYAVIIFAFLFVSSSFAQVLLKEQSVQTNYGKDLKVDLPAGDVNIKTWNKEEVYVKITGNENASNKFEFTIDSKSGNVEVKAKSKNNEDAKSISVSVDVSVPDKFNLNINTAGGDINIENSLTGDIKFNTAGGDIKINSVTGKSHINTAGGNVSILNFSGDIKVNTAGGNISLNGTGGEVKANTAGGNIALTYQGENMGIDLNTLAGNIDITVPANFKADCKLSTMAGSINSAITIEGKSKKKESDENQELKGKMNEGGEKLKCSTMGGNISIHLFNN